MLARTLAVAVGLVCGLAASQAPEFAQQYRQRLGGAIDELRTIVGRFDDDARQYGLDRSAAIARLAGNADPVARARAQDARFNAARLSDLEAQRAAMDGAGPFRRVAVMVSEADPLVWNGTLRSYEPAIPATGEGVVTAAGGAAAGWLLIRLGAWPLARRRRRARVSV